MHFEGSVVRLDLAGPADARLREGRRLLELKDRVARLFDELRTSVFRYLVSLGATPAEADEYIL